MLLVFLNKIRLQMDSLLIPVPLANIQKKAGRHLISHCGCGFNIYCISNSKLFHISWEQLALIVCDKAQGFMTAVYAAH